MYDDLIKILNEHRRVGVMCDEGCICWELERILYEHWQEQEGQPKPGSDHYFKTRITHLLIRVTHAPGQPTRYRLVRRN